MNGEALERKVRQLPTRPGVYLFKDAAGNTLYIGKAKSLRTRVRSYFRNPVQASPKNRELIRRVADVDTVVVGTEVEALLLEAKLIKENKPRFNIQFRDDKDFPYIKVTVKEPFPRILVTRRLEDDGSRYFGPFTEVGPMRHTLELIKRLYTVRSCHFALPGETPSRPCLDYHIGRCLAPCAGLQSVTEYGAMVTEIIQILSGRLGPIRERIGSDMVSAAKALDFERAAVLRDALAGLDVLEKRQRVLNARGADRDVLGIARDGSRGCAAVLRVRGGRLVGRDAAYFENLAGEPDGALIAAAMNRFYLAVNDAGRAELPREIDLPAGFMDQSNVEALLGDRARRPVRCHVARRGGRLRLVQLAGENARHLLEERVVLDQKTSGRAEDVLYELQEALNLKVVPRLITCFDISHHQGHEAVGSAVVFENGEPKKGEYRRFRLGSDLGNDDFRAMGEVVDRYFQRRLTDALPLPSLVVVDGGRAQLSAALGVLGRLAAQEVGVCALAKREEAIYLQHRNQPLRIPRRSAALRLLQRVRNEAHRFAHDYNRRLGRKRTLASILTEVPGIGPARRNALLREFGSLRQMLASTPEEIARVPGISRRLAQDIVARIRP